MKLVIKKIVLLLTYQFLVFFNRQKLYGLTVLTYHRVVKEPDLQDPLKVSAANFEKQVLFLKKHYTIISGEQLVDIIKNNKPFPENSCFITFDDGWRDNYTNAFPILKKHNVPAIIFLSTDYIGTNRILWHKKLCNILSRATNYKKLDSIKDKWPISIGEKISNIIKVPEHQRRFLINDLIENLKKYSPEEIDNFIRELEILFDVVEKVSQPVMLSWEQVKEMSKNNISFGSHTKSHAILTQVSKEKIMEEIRESKNIVENKIGKPVHFFAYPNGNYNDTITKIVKESGCLAGFTCLSKINYSTEKCFNLGRKHIMEESSSGFNGKFSDFFFKIELSGIKSLLKNWIATNLIT